MSKRYLLRRYLGWTEGEIAENERMWREERSRNIPADKADELIGGGGGTGLSDIGITSSGIDNMAPEIDNIEAELDGMGDVEATPDAGPAPSSSEQ